MKRSASGNAASAGQAAAQEKAGAAEQTVAREQCAAEQTGTAVVAGVSGPACVCCRELGQMDYEACWKLQQTLFEALLARKRSAQKQRAAVYGPDNDTRPAGTNNSNAAGMGGDDAPAAGTNNGFAPGTDQAAEKHSGNASGRDRDHGSDAGKTSGGSADGSERTGRQPETAADEAGTILLVEHPPVYTLGKSGRAENLLVDRMALERLGARFFHIDRGGDITFHGPGQLVCYPILDLERLGIGLRQYIGALEEAVIRTVAHYGIAAGRIEGASGVWIGGTAAGDRAGGERGAAGDANGNGSRHENGAGNDTAAREAAPADNISGETLEGLNGNCRCPENGAGNNTAAGEAAPGGNKPADNTSGETPGGANGNGNGNRSGSRDCRSGHSDCGRSRETASRGYDAIDAKNCVPRKICAIGVRSSRYVTMHGFALNVTTDLEWFSRINPCGFTDRGATSIERETGRRVPIKEVKDLAVKYLSEILNVKIYNN